MKKIRKIDLRLEKEVISALSESELTFVKGGGNSNTCLKPMSDTCQTVLLNTCQLTACGGCQTGNTCHELISKDGKNTCHCVYSADGNCPPPAKLTDFC